MIKSFVWEAIKVILTTKKNLSQRKIIENLLCLIWENKGVNLSFF